MGISLLLFWGLGATNGCSLHFSPSPISHSSQTRQVKYFLCGLGVLVKHTHRHTKTKPFYPSPVQSCVCSRVILFWTHSPSSKNPTTGGLVKKKRLKRLTLKCWRRKTNESSRAIVALWTVCTAVIFISRLCVCGQNGDRWAISPACHQVVVFGKQKRWQKYSRTLPLLCLCDVWTHAGQN